MDTLEVIKGTQVSKNFIANQQLNSLDDLYTYLIENPSIFARHRMYPCSFILGWNIKLCKEWLNAGWFWTTIKKDETA